jgi:tetratricopeptide (TPR) repeat protein
VEEALKKRLDFSASAKLRDRLLEDVLNAQKKSKPIETEPEIRRIIMKSPIAKLAAVVAIVASVVLSLALVDKVTSPAYAFEQTLAAVADVRYIHAIRRDQAGQIDDERWIEVGSDGFQVRYRQDNPPNRLIVEDGETVSVHYKDKNTIVLYDPEEKQYQWIANLKEWLNELAGDGSMTIEQNVDYWGRKAHLVRWLKLNINCYIDPASKLPIALAGYEVTYEEPPADVFEAVIADGVTVVDKRPGAEPVQEPEWLAAKSANDEIASENFSNARLALAAGRYEEAAELFAKVVEVQSGRNWAWFWLGKSHYELGQYDAAIHGFSKVIEMFADSEVVPHYCHLARGLAYAAKGMKNMARQDLNIALPVMIDALRMTKGATLFDYADDPLYRGLSESERPSAQQSRAMMVNRLRVVSGQNFGYDPDANDEANEQAIAAWEQWHESSGQIEFTPDAELVPVS